MISDSTEAVTLLADALHAVQPEVGLVTISSAASVTAGMQTAPPSLIVLDSHLSDTDDLEVLARLKSHPAWRAVPVVVLGRTNDDTDLIRRAYHGFASCYVTASSTRQAQVDAFRALARFWLGIAVLPKPPTTRWPVP